MIQRISGFECPVCGRSLDPAEYGKAEFDCDEAWQIVYCNCTACDRTFKFFEVYKFSHYEVEVD